MKVLLVGVKAGTTPALSPMSLVVLFSSAATLLKRRRWRSSWLKSAARNVVTKSRAIMNPIGACPLSFGHLLTQARKVGCQDGRRDFYDVVSHFGDLLHRLKAPRVLARAFSKMSISSRWRRGISATAASRVNSCPRCLPYLVRRSEVVR